MWTLLAAHAAPCDPDSDVFSAYDALLTASWDAAQARLDAAEAALACAQGPADRNSLGRFWLIEGRLLDDANDPSASLSFAAARAVAPDLWLEGLGAKAKARWTESLPLTGTGTVTLDVPRGERKVFVDGRPWMEGPLPAGLHAIQIAEPDGRICFGDMLYVGAGTATTLRTGLPPETPAELPLAKEPSTPIVLHPQLALATGASLSIGRRLEAPSERGPLTEPSAKLVFPLEFSGLARGESFWLRSNIGMGVLVAGPYLGLKANGNVHWTSLRFDVALGGGATVGVFDLGAASGIQWPGRLSERAIVSFHGVSDLFGDTPERDPLYTEIRAGINIATDRPIEPGIELLVGVALP